MMTLEERIDSIVIKSPYFADRRLRVQAVDDCVVVEGTVNTYFHKQMAQETLLRVDGVRSIENRVRVI
jgi:osmotically-inducible protein OsmY